MEASDCREWDCAGIPHPLEVVAVTAAVAAAGTAVVRVVEVVVAVEASVVVVMCFASSWTMKNKKEIFVILVFHFIFKLSVLFSPVGRDNTVAAVVAVVVVVAVD